MEPTTARTRTIPPPPPSHRALAALVLALALMGSACDIGPSVGANANPFATLGETSGPEAEPTDDTDPEASTGPTPDPDPYPSDDASTDDTETETSASDDAGSADETDTSGEPPDPELAQLGDACEAGVECEAGLVCCSSACTDPLADVLACGGCELACSAMPNAGPACDAGACIMGACELGWSDCDGSADNGCEHAGECSCEPGSVIACYTGFPSDTIDVGACHGGERVCSDAGTGYGPCIGETIPASVDVCSSGVDEDCDGEIDENPDLDGDGWGACDGDCCDQIGPACVTPALVNPGAYEFAGNGVDDDCNGQIDVDTPWACDANLLAANTNPLDYARALELCKFTTEAPPLVDRRWGVISGKLSLADGLGVPNAYQRRILGEFGNTIEPQVASKFAVLSTGSASPPGQPGFAAFQPGVDHGTQSDAPASWMAANEGTAPSAPGCPDASNPWAHDPIMLTLRVRVPTNARSFSLRFFYLSAEFPEYVCTGFNDRLLVLLDSSAEGNPVDGNLATFGDYPIGTNLIEASAGMFTACTNGTIGHCSDAPSETAECEGAGDLAGTGFTTVVGDPWAYGPTCGYVGPTGGGTGWLAATGNVTPGETIDLRIVVWDAGDHKWDSLVILDGWTWDVDPAQAGTGIAPG